MPTKSPAKATATTKPKAVTKPARVVRAKTSSRAAANKTLELNLRKNFVFVSGLVTAVLVAIALGIGTYQPGNGGVSLSGSNNTGLFLQTADLPAGGAAVGYTISVTLYANSGKQAVNTVQSALQYPADKLEVVNVTTGSTFSQEAATDTKTPGLIRIARAVPVQGKAVTGTNAVATVEFKVLQKPDQSSKIGIDRLSSLLVRSSDNKNIL